MFKLKSKIAVFALLFGCAISVHADDEVHHTLRYLTTGGYSEQNMRTIGFSPDSSQIVFSVGGKLDFIDPHLGRITGQHEARPFTAVYTRDGSRIYMISEYEATLLDTLTGTKINATFHRTPGYIGLEIEEQSGKLLVQGIRADGPASKVEGLKVGDEIVGYAQGRNGYMINVTGWKRQDLLDRLQGTAGTYLQLKVLPKGKFGDDNAKIYTIRRLPGESKNNSFTFKPFTPAIIDDNLAWCISDDHHEFRSAATGLPVARLQTIDVDNVGQYAISPDQTKFAIVARPKENSKTNAVEVFDIATQDRLAYIPMVLGTFNDIEFCADNNRVLVSTYDTVEVCDVAKSKLVGRLDLGWKPPEEKEEEGEAYGDAGVVVGASQDRAAFSERDKNRSPVQLVSELAVSSRGIVATGDGMGNLKLWDLNSGELLKELPKNPEKHLDALLFSPDGKWLVYFIHGVLHIVDVSNVEPIPTEGEPRYSSIPTVNPSQPNP